MVHPKIEPCDDDSPHRVKKEVVDKSNQQTPDVKPKQKLNAFEVLMKSSQKTTPDGTSSARRASRGPKIEPKDTDNKVANGTPKVSAAKTSRKHRSRSQSPEVITISSQQSEQENVEDGIIGMKVRSPNTSICSVQESP